MSERFIRVAALAEIPEGELRAFDVSGERVCIAHVGLGVFAFGDECTHAGCSLAEEGVPTEGEDAVECSCHGSVFDVRSGEPLMGPARDPLPVFRSRVVDGWVEVAPLAEA